MATGYGYDIWCIRGMQTGRFARGPMVVLQALARRVTTGRGTLLGVVTVDGSFDADEDLSYGLDLSEYLGETGFATSVAAFPSLVEAELGKDDRVLDVTASAVVSTASNGDMAITLTVDVTLQDAKSNYTLTLEVTEVSAELVDISEVAA